MRYLILGSAGMLGRAVVRAAERAGHEAVAATRLDADVTDPAALARVFDAAAPDAVVNCAAWTDVDGAEAGEEQALRVNGLGAGNVARAAAACGARLVHVSTDYVFDGAKGEPWLESDPVGPLQAYGRTKLAGERAVAESNPEHAIVRTAWLYGAHGTNFVDTMLRLAAERDEVSVVSDQVGRPTWTGHLAPALVALAERRAATGVFHATGPGECSWFDFATAVMREGGLACRVVPTTSDRFVRPARRPAYSVLGTERAPAVVLPPWEDGLRAYLAERVGAAA